MNTQMAIANIIVIVVTGLFTYAGFKNRLVIEKYLLSVPAIINGKEYYRILSSAFIHLNWAHLLFNMFSLYSFGRYIELVLGIHIFLLIYVTSIIGGNLLALGIRRGEDYRALGASGGVSGILFACIFLFPGGGVYVFPLPFAIPSWLYAIIFVLVSSYGMQRGEDSIGHEAHMGGAIAGLLFTALYFPEVIGKNIILFFFILIASILFLFWQLFKKSKKKW